MSTQPSYFNYLPIFGGHTNDSAANLEFHRKRAEEARQAYLQLANERGVKIEDETRIVIIRGRAFVCELSLADAVDGLQGRIERDCQQHSRTLIEFQDFKRDFAEMEAHRANLLGQCKTSDADDY